MNFAFGGGSRHRRNPDCASPSKICRRQSPATALTYELPLEPMEQRGWCTEHPLNNLLRNCRNRV